MEFEVLARCGDQGTATQPQQDQNGEEEAAEQYPPRQPRAPVPRAGTAQLSEPHTAAPGPARPTGTHRDMQLRKSFSCWSSDSTLALLVFTRVLVLLTLSKGPKGSGRWGHSALPPTPASAKRPTWLGVGNRNQDLGRRMCRARVEVQGILGVSGAEETGHQTVAILPMCPSRASGWDPFQVTSTR